jgi:hypothetical protein
MSGWRRSSPWTCRMERVRTGLPWAGQVVQEAWLRVWKSCRGRGRTVKGRAATAPVMGAGGLEEMACAIEVRCGLPRVVCMAIPGPLDEIERKIRGWRLHREDLLHLVLASGSILLVQRLGLLFGVALARWAAPLFCLFIMG